MKRYSLAVFVLVLAAGCSPEGDPLRLIIMPAPADCLVLSDPGSATSTLAGGLLDVGPGSPAYFVQLGVIGAEKISQLPVTVAGQSLEAPGRETPVIDSVTYTYNSRPKKFSRLTKETFELRGAFPPGKASATLLANLIGPNTAKVLSDVTNVPLYDGTPDTVKFLDVTIEAHGHMSGSGATLTTGQVTLPIQVVRSDQSMALATCPINPVTMTTNGFKLCGATTNGCCQYIGQDANPALLAATNPANPYPCCGGSPAELASCRVP